MLESDGMAVELGSRALDILMVLVEHAGQVVSHKELMARVWRGLVVDPGNLRVHVMRLRKALDDGRTYIRNIPGQGYSFVAPIRHAEDCPTRTGRREHGADRPRRALPAPLSRMVGREEMIHLLASEVRSHRLVTIVGPGGMGKTTVAVAIAHALRDEFSGAVCFVDLSSLNDPAHVAHAVAAALDLPAPLHDPFGALLESLRIAHMLLVLDNCEHVVEAVASLAEAIHSEAANVHVLATSREALRAEGERVSSLPPLAIPPTRAGLSAAEVMSYAAVKLFVERAEAAGVGFELSDAEALAVAYICGTLDGIPLAIELAANRASVNGVEDTARLLGNRFGMQWQGRRTALPRHRTLQATLDWSYALLTDIERRVLRSIAMLCGAFTLESAQAVASGPGVSRAQVVTSLDQLVAKSLAFATRGGDGTTRYRLYATTRLYALARLEESGGAERVARRHARHFANANVKRRAAAPVAAIRGDDTATLS